MFYLILPVIFLKFWFWEAPREILNFFVSLNLSTLRLLSLPILVKTYFRPWKNEYRKGLVGFSIAMGMFIKTFVISADIVLFLILFSLEIVFLIAFLFWPIGIFLFLLI